MSRKGDIVRQKARASPDDGTCGFCGDVGPKVSLLPTAAIEPWDRALEPLNSSPVHCRHCSSRNKDAAGRARRGRGLVSPPDLDHWPKASVAEFVAALLAVAERPPVDSSGFYPGQPFYGNRPVRAEDLKLRRRRGEATVGGAAGGAEDGRGRSNNISNSTVSLETEVWRAEWGDVQDGHERPDAASFAADAPEAPVVPGDWQALRLGTINGTPMLPQEALSAFGLEALWMMADAQTDRMRARDLLPTPPRQQLSQAQSQQPSQQPSRGFNDSILMPAATQRQQRQQRQASLERQVSPERPGSKGGAMLPPPSPPFAALEQPSHQPTAPPPRALAGQAVMSAGVPKKGLTRLAKATASTLGLPVPNLIPGHGGRRLGLGGPLRVRCGLGGAGNGPGGVTTAAAGAASGGGGGATGCAPEVAPVAGGSGAGVGAGKIPAGGSASGAGAPAALPAGAGCFHFAHHGHLLGVLLALVRRSPAVRAQVQRFLPGLLDRALKVPVRAHSPASRASFFLLCSLAADFRQDLAKVRCVERVLWSLVGEEALAATVIQLYWKRRHARAILAAREAVSTEAAAEAQRQKQLAARSAKREARWAAEKAGRIAAKAAGVDFVEMSPEEEAEADAQDAADIARAFEEASEGDTEGKRRSPFESQRAIIGAFHRSHVKFVWARMTNGARLGCAVPVLRLWVGAAKGLLNADLKGKSDPYVVVRVAEKAPPAASGAEGSVGGSGSGVLGGGANRVLDASGVAWREVHRTRVVKDSLEPVFGELAEVPLPPSWARHLKRRRRALGRQLCADGGGTGASGDAANKASEEEEEEEEKKKKKEEEEEEEEEEALRMVVQFALYDYDAVGRNDPLGTATLTLCARDVDKHMVFVDGLPVMMKTKYFTNASSSSSSSSSSAASSLSGYNAGPGRPGTSPGAEQGPQGQGQGERMVVQRGSLGVGFCVEEGEAAVPKEVDLDLFRGSVKLLALLTEPSAANGEHMHTHMNTHAISFSLFNHGSPAARVPQTRNSQLFLPLHFVLVHLRPGSYAARSARFLSINGGLVPLAMAITGEFSDDDLRIQVGCSCIGV